jgi:pyruvate, water dikinase
MVRVRAPQRVVAARRGGPATTGFSVGRASCALAFLLGLVGSGSSARPGGAASPPQPRLLSTGQAIGYRGDAGVPADGNGDDGDLVRGRLLDYGFTATDTPATQDENVAVDANTGLMWIRDLGLLDRADGQGVHGNRVLSATMSWQAAIDAASDLVYAGHDDWRVPNARELGTLVDFGRASLALDPDAFPAPLNSMASTYLWSSTTNPVEPSQAYYVNTFDGHLYPWPKPTRFMVRPVRTTVVDDPVPLIRTGQTVGYRGDGPATQSGNGDDGDLRLGVAPDYLWADDGTIDTPAENVVVDRNTDLMWLRDPARLDGSGGVGGNVALSVPTTWQTAIDRCNALDYAGHDDWRLPNIREIESITQVGRADASSEPAAFARVPPAAPGELAAIWWSSTTSAVNQAGTATADAAWYFTAAPPVMRHHVTPEVRPARARPGYARCVRDVATAARDPRYLAEVRSSADFDSVTVAVARAGIDREGKFLLAVPGTAGPFTAAYQDVKLQALHYEFLRDTFPDTFAGLTTDEYTALVARRATRRYFAGGLRLFTTAAGERVFGFDVYTADGQADELLSQGETDALYRQLRRTFRRRPLVYSPTTPDAVARAATWRLTRFPIAYPGTPPPADFDAYTTGIAYGTVRLMTLADLPGAVQAGEISWQDVLVLDRVPADIETIVAGIVTGERQGELSHLNVRSARRGTPNAYVRDSHAAFRTLAGHLVRMVVGRDGYTVTPDVPRAEAEGWWAAHRPDPVDLPAIDTVFGDLALLGEIGADDVDGSATLRVGGKAANLARLYTFLPPRHQVPGFAVPFRFYLDYMRDNTIEDRRADPRVTRTLADYVADLTADARFRTDPVWRSAILTDLRSRMAKDGAVSPALVDALTGRIISVFGPSTMVRFRSSSNAEDDLRFNGAGLYDSTSVCAEDSLDNDVQGPSHCDPNQPKERTIERGLRTVWASLWNARAWDERAYYGIDQSRVAMAVLVTTAFPDERANGVAFTGNPTAPTADEFLINAQYGDTSVVLPDPGVVPERDLLSIAGGQVSAIRRVQPSSLVAPGTHVLSDDELRTLGGLMFTARERFPLDLQRHDPADVLLDFEFKIRRSDDELLLKQVRPFLVRETNAPTPSPSLVLDVPAPLNLCTMWRPSLPIRREYDDKAVITLHAGTFSIPLDSTSSEHDLLGDLRVGPEGVLATPTGPGRASVAAQEGMTDTLRVTFARTYRAGEREIEAHVDFFTVPADEVSVRRLDADNLTAGDSMMTLRDATDATSAQMLGPCGLGVLPLQQLTVRLEGDQRVDLRLRKGRGFFSYQWAELVGADVRLAAGTRTVADYPHLVYDAVRHNWNETFWVLFDPPLGDAHCLSITQQGTAPGEGEYRAALLDDRLDVLRSLAVGSVTVGPGPPGPAIYLPATSAARDP